MKINSLNQLNKFSLKIASEIDLEDCIFLIGEIGVGKTTFVRYFINNLEKKNKLKKSQVLSPTFNIVYDYNVGSYKIMHYDLYRLRSKTEVKQLGIFEEREKSVKIIEWPQLIKNTIKNKLEIHFSYSDKLNTRNIKILGTGKWKNFKLN
mgnify:CR=1 FL=1